MTSNSSAPPPVTWAQQKNTIFVTICVEDCKSPIIKLESNMIYFEGKGGPENKDYQVTIDLFAEIDSQKSRHFARDRVIEFILLKKDESVSWPRLTKDKIKYHWLRVDFVKWGDDGSDEENDIYSKLFEGDGRLPADKLPNLNDIPFSSEDEDSDDDDIMPDLE